MEIIVFLAALAMATAAPEVLGISPILQETSNVDTPHYVLMADKVTAKTEEILDAHLQHIDTKIQNLNDRIEHACTGQRNVYRSDINEVEGLVFDNPLQRDLQTFDDKIVEIIDSFVERLSSLSETLLKQMEDKIAASKNDILQEMNKKNTLLTNDIALLTEKIGNLPTQTQVAELQTNLSTAITGISQAVETLATEEYLAVKLNEVIVTQVSEMKEVFLNTSTPPKNNTCGSQETVNNILTAVTSTQTEMDALVAGVKATGDTVADHCVQGISEKMEGLMEQLQKGNQDLAALTFSVAHVEGNLTSRLSELELIITQIYNNTYEPPPPPTTTTPMPTTSTPPLVTSTQGAQTPCLDSSFTGNSPYFNVCEAAVRFKKCDTLFLSYHCCRTCTDAGALPSSGRWSYLSYPRHVSILEALFKMSPSVKRIH